MNISILLAEDNSRVRRAMASFLMHEGYFVSEAATGLEALQLFKELRPHLVLSDLCMPEMDGLQFLKAVREESGHTPFIIVSGQGNMADVIEGLRLGAWDYLIKPVTPLALLKHSVERALERVQLLEKSRNHQQYLEETIAARTVELESKNLALEKEVKERIALEEMAWKVRNEWVRTIDALPEMIAIVDTDHNIIRLNRAMQQIIGKPMNEIIGHPCRICAMAEPCPHERMLENRLPVSIDYYSDELQCHLALDIIPYFSADNDLLGSVHVFKDITEQKKSIREKEILQAQLLQAHKLESIGQLAAGIAHEMNTPTQYVSTNVEFLNEAFTDVRTLITALKDTARSKTLNIDQLQVILDEADWPYLDKEIPEAIKQSQDGLSRISSIVRAMKEFSHPGGKEYGQADINHIIEVTVAVAKNEWKYGADVILKLAADLPPVSCMANEISQVILNLLVNAAQAINEKIARTPDRKKGVITITTELAEPWLVVSITDSGGGIPEPIQGKIFDPFFTTKEVGKGTGQGLAIAYDVVTRKHGGKLTFTTVQDEGTTFTLQLPVQGR